VKAWLHYLPHVLGLVLLKSLGDYLLKKTESIAANSVRELLAKLLGLLLTKKESIMEKDVALGSVGKLALTFSGGKAQVAVEVELPGGVSISVKVADDAGALIDQIKAAVEKAAPSSTPIDEAVFGLLKSAVVSIP
jgi:hypothetical protein